MYDRCARVRRDLSEDVSRHVASPWRRRAETGLRHSAQNDAPVTAVGFGLALLVAAVDLGHSSDVALLPSVGGADHESQPQDHNPDSKDGKQLALREPGVGGVPPV